MGVIKHSPQKGPLFGVCVCVCPPAVLMAVVMVMVWVVWGGLRDHSCFWHVWCLCFAHVQVCVCVCVGEHVTSTDKSNLLSSFVLSYFVYQIIWGLLISAACLLYYVYIHAMWRLSDCPTADAEQRAHSHVQRKKTPTFCEQFVWKWVCRMSLLQSQIITEVEGRRQCEHHCVQSSPLMPSNATQVPLIREGRVFTLIQRTDSFLV